MSKLRERRRCRLRDHLRLDFEKNVCVMSDGANVANGDCVMKLSVVFFVIESALLEVNMMEIFAFTE